MVAIPNAVAKAYNPSVIAAAKFSMSPDFSVCIIERGINARDKWLRTEKGWRKVQ